MAHEKASFSIVDYALFIGTIAISVLIGVFFAFKKGGQKTTAQFFLGDRKMPLIPTALSLLVSFQSGILILGFSSEIYIKGITFIFYLVAVCVAIPLSCITYVPVFYELKITSVFEYLEMRYQSKAVRVIGSIFSMTGNLLYTSIVLYAPSTAMAAVSNISLDLLIVLTAVSCTFYTMIGGLKAVVWADAFQAMIMYAGLIAVLVQGVIQAGGFGHVYQRMSEGGRMYFEATADPFVYMNIWVVIFGSIIGWMTVYGTSQASVQRYCSLSTLRQAQASMLLVVPGLVTMAPLVFISGAVMYAYYYKCDPLMLGQISNRDQLLPYFTLEVLGKSLNGLPGIFLALLYSGTLSTVSTMTNSISAVVWEDYIKPFHGHRFTELQATRFNKLLVLIFGMIAMGLAFLAQFLGGVFQASLTVLSTVGAPTAGLFLLGIGFPWATREGALAGVFSAISVVGWICIGAQVTKPYRQSLPRSIENCANATLWASDKWNANTTSFPIVEPVTNPTMTGISYIYKLSYKAYGITGIMIVLIVGIAVSLCTRKTYDLDENERRCVWPGYFIIFDKLGRHNIADRFRRTKVPIPKEAEKLLLEKVDKHIKA